MKTNRHQYMQTNQERDNTATFYNYCRAICPVSMQPLALGYRQSATTHLEFRATITKSEGFLCRDGADMPIVRVYQTRDVSRSKPFRVSYSRVSQRNDTSQIAKMHPSTYYGTINVRRTCTGPLSPMQTVSSRAKYMVPRTNTPREFGPPDQNPCRTKISVIVHRKLLCQHYTQTHAGSIWVMEQHGLMDLIKQRFNTEIKGYELKARATKHINHIDPIRQGI